MNARKATFSFHGLSPLSRSLRPAMPFVHGMPTPLKIWSLLGISPLHIPGISLEKINLKGPKLMWGQSYYCLSQAHQKQNSKLKQLGRFFLGNSFGLSLFAFLITFAFLSLPLVAQGFPSIKPTIIERAESPEDVTSTIELLLLLTVLSLAPSILIMTTAFTRIIIVLGFLRMALSTQQLPPTQILTGLALILTFLIMRPTIVDIKDQAIIPYLDAEITQAEAFDNSVRSLRSFMFAQVSREDLLLFGDISASKAEEKPENWKTYGDIDTLTLIPAFVLTELKRGFFMGFMLYLPFLIIDLIVATVLISMGMLVLPPVLISLPFKLLLFVLVDGWGLVVKSLISSFNPETLPPGG